VLAYYKRLSVIIDSANAFVKIDIDWAAGDRFFFWNLIFFPLAINRSIKMYSI
jgi:hypothetical protein